MPLFLPPIPTGLDVLFNENSFVVAAFTPKLRGVTNGFESVNFCVTHPYVRAIICRFDFPCFVGVYLRAYRILHR